jgi:uncharacterized damage-inducible protein DinB
MRQRIVTGVLVGLGLLVPSVAPLGAQGGDATIASVKTTYDLVKGNIIKAAAQVPPDKYAYQPTKEVRTMGQLFGHIADSSAAICATATGQKPGAGGAEKLATKAELQKAVAAAFAACDKAMTTITPANANESVSLFGMTHTRIGAMAFNAAHLFEHYGNLVTYMRINGMVPPSSQGQ